MKQQILIADSTQIEAYSTCPQMWDFEYHQSLTLPGEVKDDLRMGTLGHKWMELYYKNVLSGSAPAFAIASKFDPDALDETDNHQYPLDAEKRKKVFNRCRDYWMNYTAKGSDFIPLSKQKRYIGIDDNGLPVDCIKQEPLVELGFSYELFRSPEYLFILEGRIDLLSSFNNNNAFVDHKFQLRERKLYPKSIQFKNYALVTGCNLGVINYIRLHDKISDSTFVRELISFNSQEMRLWKSELIEIFVTMARDVRDDNQLFAYQRRWSSCSGKFGYFCRYAPICEEPARDLGNLIKVQKYVPRKEWRPW